MIKSAASSLDPPAVSPSIRCPQPFFSGFRLLVTTAEQVLDDTLSSPSTPSHSRAPSISINPAWNARVALHGLFYLVINIIFKIQHITLWCTKISMTRPPGPFLEGDKSSLEQSHHHHGHGHDQSYAIPK